MVTLVDPGQGLWALVWANVPNGTPQGAEALPWLRPTRTSDDGKPPTYPPQSNAPPVEVFFGMPRRLRLEFDNADHVTGVIQRPHGTNYAGWDHPLTPYYRKVAGGDRFAQRPRAGEFCYRNWLGIVMAAPQTALTERAACVRNWLRRTSNERAARVLVSGWALKSAQPLDFTWSSQPLVSLDIDAELLLAGMVEAAECFVSAMRGALAPAVAAGRAREALLEAFYTCTQPTFEQRLAELVRGTEPNIVAQEWLKDMREVAMSIFDKAAIPVLDQRRFTRKDKHKKEIKVGTVEEIVSARSILLAAFSGRTRQGRDAYGKLELEPRDKKVEEPA